MFRRLLGITLSTVSLAVFVPGCSCGSAPLKATQGEVSATPPLLIIGAYNSCGRIEQFNLVNSGRSATDVTVTLEGDGVFQLRNWDTASNSVREHLAPGSNRIDVQCSSAHDGSYDAKLNFEVLATGQKGTMHLHCDIVDAPACTTSNPCEPAIWNQQTCECVHSRIDEGGSCSTGDLCKVNETCVRDQCVGSPKNCNDSDLCTRDSCVPGRGCFNVNVQDELCPLPTNPCMVEICDRSAGCMEVPADNKKCGESSCRLAQVCQGGQCVNRTPRDGDPCVGDCGDGTCQAQLCIGKEGSLLTAHPGIEVPSNQENRGLTAPGGGVILVDPKAPALSADTEGGQQLWSRGLTWSGAWAEAMLWDDKLVVSTGLNLAWIDSGTGALRHDTELKGHAPDAMAIAGYGIAVRAGDNVVTAFKAQNPTPETCDDALRLEAYSELGIRAWTSPPTFTGDLNRDPLGDGGVVADEAGNVLLVLAGCGGTETLQAVDPKGKPLWALPLDGCSGCEVQAAYRGRAYLAGDLLVQYTQAGATVNRLGPDGRSPILTDELAIVFDPIKDPEGVRMRIVGATGSANPQEVPLPGARSVEASLLTKTGTVMVLETRGTTDAPTAWIAELAPDGRQLRECQVDEGTPSGPPAIAEGNGILVGTLEKRENLPDILRVKRYEIPRFGLAEGGWRAQAGGPDRAWSP